MQKLIISSVLGTYVFYVENTKILFSIKLKNTVCHYLYLLKLSHFLIPDTRETGFVNAMIAAGITFQVTRACTKGEQIGCSCSKRKKKKNKKNRPPLLEGEWDGCGENIEFGIKKSKDFLDTRYRKRSDMKTLVKLHNYVAGRLVSSNWIFSNIFFS